MEKGKSIYKLIFLVVAVITVILIAVEISLAWFMSESTTDNSDTGVKVIGKIALDVDYDFSFYNDALPPDTYITTNKTGEDISTYVKTSVDNNIDEVFVKIKFKTNIQQLSLYFVDNLTQETSYTSDCDNKWVLSATTTETRQIGEGEGAENETIYVYEYYYVGLVGSDNVKFNQGYYVNNHIDNTFKQDDVYIKMEVYGLQSQYGAYLEDDDWKTAPSIFSTYAYNTTNY